MRDDTFWHWQRNQQAQEEQSRKAAQTAAQADALKRIEAGQQTGVHQGFSDNSSAVGVKNTKPRKRNDRDQVIVDSYKSQVGGDELMQSIAEAEAEALLWERSAQRTYAEQAPPEIRKKTENILKYITNSSNRFGAVEEFRKLPKAEQEEVIRLAPGVMQQLGDDRGNIAWRALSALWKGFNDTFTNPMTEMVGLSLSPEEVQIARQLEGLRQQEAGPSRADDWMISRGALGAVEMVPFAVAAARGGGLGRSAGASIGARLGMAGTAMATAGQVAGVTAASYPSMYISEYHTLKDMGMEDTSQLRGLAGASALIGGAIESIVPDVFPGRVRLTQGVSSAIRQYLWEAAKKYPGELSEEGLQGISSGLAQHVAQYLDENVEEKSLKDAIMLGVEQVNESALKMVFLIGAPAVASAGLSPPQAKQATAEFRQNAESMTPKQVEQSVQRLSQLEMIRAKKFIPEETAVAAGIPGKSRKERLSNVDEEIFNLRATLDWRLKSPNVDVNQEVQGVSGEIQSQDDQQAIEVGQPVQEAEEQIKIPTDEEIAVMGAGANAIGTEAQGDLQLPTDRELSDIELSGQTATVTTDQTTPVDGSKDRPRTSKDVDAEADQLEMLVMTLEAAGGGRGIADTVHQPSLDRAAKLREEIVTLRKKAKDLRLQENTAKYEKFTSQTAPVAEEQAPDEIPVAPVIDEAYEEDALAQERAKRKKAKAGVAPEVPGTPEAQPSPSVGQFVQWTSNGADQFKEPKKVVGVETNDGVEYLQLEGESTWIPAREATVVKPKAGQLPEDQNEQLTKSPEWVDFGDDSYGLKFSEPGLGDAEATLRFDGDKSSVYVDMFGKSKDAPAGTGKKILTRIAEKTKQYDPEYIEGHFTNKPALGSFGSTFGKSNIEFFSKQTGKAVDVDFDTAMQNPDWYIARARLKPAETTPASNADVEYEKALRKTAAQETSDWKKRTRRAGGRQAKNEFSDLNAAVKSALKTINLKVSDDLSPKAIQRAFRKAAAKAHPDSGGSVEQMAALNEAVELLSSVPASLELAKRNWEKKKTGTQSAPVDDQQAKPRPAAEKATPEADAEPIPKTQEPAAARPATDEAAANPTEADFDAMADAAVAELKKKSPAKTKTEQEKPESPKREKRTGRKSDQTKADAAAKRAAAKKAMADVMKKLDGMASSGVNPVIMKEIVSAALLYVEADIKTFKGYVEAIIEDFGDAWAMKYAPYLEAAWRALNRSGDVKDPAGKFDEHATKTEALKPAAEKAEQLPKPKKNEDAAFFRRFGLKVSEANGQFYIQGDTREWKETIKDAAKGHGGARFFESYRGEPAWQLTKEGYESLQAVLRGLPIPDGATRGSIPNYVRDPQFRGLRASVDERPDNRRPTEALKGLVSDATQGLILAGEKFGIPKDILGEQIEDVGMILDAHDRGENMFLLANEPGSGKTFVLGAAIRELQAKGAKTITYVTLREELIDQIKKDLAGYGIENVNFVTYAGLRTRDKDTKKLKRKPGLSDVLIFDEAHSIKNLDSEQGAIAEDWIQLSEFSIFASATPFENPVQAKYLSATGVFDDLVPEDRKGSLHGFKTFATIFGAQVSETRDNVTVKWVRTATSDEDAKAAQSYLSKRGLLTTRRIRLPVDQVDSRMVKVNAPPEHATRYSHLAQAAISREDKLNGHAKAWVVNLQKRMLEDAKLQLAIQEADAALDRGRFPIIFVETKEKRSHDIPTLVEQERLYQRVIAGLQRGEPKPKRSTFGLPPAGVVEVLDAYMQLSGQKTLEIAAPIATVRKHFGKRLAVFTGASTGEVTQGSAHKDLAAWRAGTKPVLMATMAKGGTGLSLHDTKGDHPTTQIGVNMPWTATQLVQVAQRSARYGLAGKAEIIWLFADNIPFDRMLAGRVGGRMADMGATVHGQEVSSAANLLDWNFEDELFSEEMAEKEAPKKAATEAQESDKPLTSSEQADKAADILSDMESNQAKMREDKKLREGEKLANWLKAFEGSPREVTAAKDLFRKDFEKARENGVSDDRLIEIIEHGQANEMFTEREAADLKNRIKPSKQRHELLLDRAAPYVEKGESYKRDIADPAMRLQTAIAKGNAIDSSLVQTLTDELEVILDYWEPLLGKLNVTQVINETWGNEQTLDKAVERQYQADRMPIIGKAMQEEKTWYQTQDESLDDKIQAWLDGGELPTRVYGNSSGVPMDLGNGAAARKRAQSLANKLGVGVAIVQHTKTFKAFFVELPVSSVEGKIYGSQVPLDFDKDFESVGAVAPDAGKEKKTNLDKINDELLGITTEKIKDDLIAKAAEDLGSEVQPKQSEVKDEARDQEDGERPDTGTVEQDRGAISGYGVKGKSTAVITADGKTRRATYYAIEAGDLIPSHDARRNFAKNQGALENERPYHDPKQGADSRQIVERIAQVSEDKISLLTSDTQSPIDGPPILDDSGAVLGGNARSMGMQLAYASKQGSRLKAHVEAEAEKFGIPVDQVKNLKEPVIVRVLEEVFDRGTISALLNEALAASKSQATVSVSQAKRVSDTTVDMISGFLSSDENPSLRDILATPKKSDRIVKALVEDGAWSQREVDLYVDPNTNDLNEAGKTAIEQLLVAKVIPDVSVLGDAAPSVKLKLLAAIAPIVKGMGDPTHGDRIRENILEAVLAYNGYIADKGGTLQSYFFDQSALVKLPGFNNYVAASFVYALNEMSPSKFRAAMREITSLLGIGERMQSLFGEMDETVDSLEEAIRQVINPPISQRPSPDTLFQIGDEEDFVRIAVNYALDAEDAGITSYDDFMEFAANAIKDTRRAWLLGPYLQSIAKKVGFDGVRSFKEVLTEPTVTRDHVSTAFHAGWSKVFDDKEKYDAALEILNAIQLDQLPGGGVGFVPEGTPIPGGRMAQSGRLPQSGDTLVDAIDGLSLTETQQALWDELRDVLANQKQGMPSLRVEETGDYAGAYDPMSHTISVVVPKSMKLGTARVLLHEAVHAATRDAALIASAPFYHGDRARDVPQSSKQAFERLQKVFYELNNRKLAQGSPDILGEYGLTNELELISEAFTNDKFRAELSKIKVSGSSKFSDLRGKNLLQEFIGIIKQLLGIKSARAVTALEEVIGLSTTIMEGDLRAKKGQTNTPAFKRWFGDSKVVDTDGKPLVVYHGSSQTFDVFDIGRLNSRNEGPGFYFTTSKDVASGYVNRTSGDGQLVEAYLSIKKPLAYDAKPFKAATLQKLVMRIAEIEAESDNGDIRDGFLSNFGDTYSDGIAGVSREAAKLLSKDESAVDQISGIVGSGVSAEHVLRAVTEVTGHDGIVAIGFSNEGTASNTIYVAFNPTQIKSATGNQGTFDPSNPSILFQNQNDPNGNVKGWTKFISATRAIIGATDKADFSTFIHELFHPMRRFLLDRSIPLDKRQGITDEDLLALEKYAEVQYEKGKDGKPDMSKPIWDTPAEEKAAKAWEQYWLDGWTDKLPAALKPLFEKIARWMRGIYQGVQLIAHNELTPQVRALFDKIVQRGYPDGFQMPPPFEGPGAPPVGSESHPEKLERIFPNAYEFTAMGKSVVNYLRGLSNIPGLEANTKETVEEWVQQADMTLRADPYAAERLYRDVAASGGRPLDQHEVTLLAFHQRKLANVAQAAYQETVDAAVSGDPARIAQARTNSILARQPLTEFEELIYGSKSTMGRAFYALQVMFREDFTPGGLMKRAREANHGKPLNKDQIAEIDKLSEENDKLQKEVDRLRNKYEREEADTESKKQHDDVTKDAPTPKPRQSTPVQKTTLAAAWDRLKSFAGIDTLFQQDSPYDGIAQAYRDIGVSTYAELMRHVQERVGKDKAKELRNEFRAAWKNTSPDIDISGVFDMGDSREMTRLARAIQRDLVEGGFRDRVEIIELVREEMSQQLERDITTLQAMDWLSGYGQFTIPSKEPIEAILRKLNTENLKHRQIIQLGDALARVEQLRAQGMTDQQIGDQLVAEGLLVKPTGPQRDKDLAQDIDIRALQREYNDLKSQIPVSTENREGMLQTRMGSIQRALANRIADIKEALATGKPINNERRAPLTNPEIENRREQLAEAVKEYRDTFPKKPMSEAQRIKNAIKAAERSIAVMEKQIASQNFDKPKSLKVSSPELEILQAQKTAMRAQIEALKALELSQWEGGASADNSHKREAAIRKNYIASVERRIAEYERILAEKDFKKKVKVERKLTDEELKAQNQLREVRQKVLEAFAKYHVANLKGVARVLDAVTETAALSRAIKTSLDLSALLNQGALMALSRPVLTARVLKDVARILKSQFDSGKLLNRENLSLEKIEDFLTGIDTRQAEFNHMQMLTTGEDGEFKLKVGLALTASDQDLTKQEEAFQGRWAKYWPGVAISGRVYVMLVNGLRSAMFDALANGLYIGGRQMTLEEGKLLASFVNVTTGRSDLKGIPILEQIEKHSAVLNTVFFAARFVAARFQYLAMPFYLPFAGGGVSKAWNVKKAIYVEIMRTTGSYMTVLGAVSLLSTMFWDDDDEERPTIGTDPTTSDFGKVKFGDTRIDFGGGILQSMVFLSRFGLGRQGDTQFGEGHQPMTRAKLALQFIRYKLAPVPGFIWTGLDGWKDPVGNVQDELLGFKVHPMIGTGVQMFVPLTTQNMYDAVADHGMAGLPLAAMAFLGVRISTYGPKTKYAYSTLDERSGQLDKFIKKMTWDSPDPEFHEFLSTEEYEQVQARRANRKQSLVNDALDDQKPDSFQDPEDYTKAIAKRDAAIEAIRSAGWGSAEIRQLLLDHWKSNHGSARRLQGGMYVLKDQVRDRVRRINKLFGGLPGDQ